VDVPVNGGRKHPHGNRIRINTQNILFICGGAFEALTMEKKKEKTVGFSNEAVKDEEKSEVTAETLKKQGLIPELIGRLPIIVRLDELTVEDLEKILTDTKNSIVRQYTELIGMDDVELEIDKAALKFIAKEAYDKKTGARGLKSIIEKTMRDVMFEVPSEPDVTKVLITVENEKLIVEKLTAGEKIA
jgi:ATP-dependent Clp protease ATP-binding subunit ClpX